MDFVRGDLFASGCLVLVDPCNCVGAQGAGISRQFAERFPELNPGYRMACRRGELAPGTPLWQQAMDGTVVCRFPTKLDWRNPSQLGWIRLGLGALRAVLLSAPTLSVAVPPLGCGLGGLRWEDVRPLLERALGEFPNVRCYLPR